ncbi:MAG TPA: hypothetical protein VL443_09860 [Cyclobacteriaceae bacterium]|jgi:hypothetical protein|nr:hypothetical protein [Cyclobacteriaceae bacterium]
MARALAVILLFCIALGACTQRLICPAYQSAFIYDKEALRKKFSYFVDDSTPKILTASKTKYLIAQPTSYSRKIRSLQTVEMKPVFPVVPDSLRDDYVVSKAELDSAARSIIDSTYIVDVPQKNDSTQSAEDSVYVITKDKEVRLLKYDPDSMKYSVVDVRLNVDQDNYMWYLRANLVLPDVKLAKQQGEKEAREEKQKSKKGFFGFFKNLFKKKKKEKVDTTTVVPVKGEHDFDYVDTTAVKPVAKQETVKKKKGLFSIFSRKNKKEKVAPDNSKAVKEEDAVAPEEKPKKKKKKKNSDEPTEQTDPNKPEEKKDDGF